MKAKYIIIEENGFPHPVIFPPYYSHSTIRNKWADHPLLSAGTLEVCPEIGLIVEPGSYTLGIATDDENRRKNDTTILRILLINN